MQEGFVKTLLTGIRRWTNDKLSSITSRLSDVEDAVEDIAFEELTYHERALYTQYDVFADGIVTKVGKIVTIQVHTANTIDGWYDVSYRLPYEPDANFLAVINSRGMYESYGIHYKVVVEHKTVEIEPDVSVVYPALTLKHYVNGTTYPWEMGQNVSFKIDYITSE